MLVRVFGAIFRRWRERRQRKAAIRDLRALSDRTLKDMGLTRGEIVGAVHGQVYRGEQTPSREPASPSPREPAAAGPIDAATLQHHLDRARQARAEFMTGLLRLGFSKAARFLSAAPSRIQPLKENRDVRRSNHAA
jgi:uncharacterized protein YjiS (DUF1127 family)